MILSLISLIMKMEHKWGEQRESRYLPVCDDVGPISKYSEKPYFNDILATENVCRGKEPDEEHTMAEIVSEMLGDRPGKEMLEALKNLAKSAMNIKKGGNYELPKELRETMNDLVFYVKDPKITEEVLSALSRRRDDKSIHRFLNNVEAQIDYHWNTKFKDLMIAIKDIE